MAAVERKAGDKVNYPKPVMTISELKKMGFPKEYLYRAVHSQYSKKFAVKQGKNNSKYQIDTAEFEKIRQRGLLV